MHERSISLVTKGKAKESVHWHLGWWDLCHSLEGTRRPVQWSKSSVIFTSHESRPFIVARHSPSSRQFVLPTPPFSLEPYEPATVISICPTDDWIFAYFPGSTGPGIGCVWRKDAQLDGWVLKECWNYPVGGGVVTAAWTSPRREWVVSDAGTSTRLPPLGPLTPTPSPLLLLVTEAHLLHVYNLSSLGAKIPPPTRVHLLQTVDPSNPPTDPESVGKVGGDKLCVKATIGLTYQDSNVLIAMRSQLLPSHNSSQGYQNQLDLGLSMDLGQPSADSPFAPEWELWGEEQVISLCEVRIEYRPGAVPVLSRPLPPIYHPGSRVIDLVFYGPPPGNAKPGPKGSPPITRTLHLAATFMDVEDYTSLPKSQLVSYTFTGTSQNRPVNYWTLRGEVKRSIQTKVPCFLLPSVTRGGFVAGFLDPAGLLPRRKSKTKETTIGTIEMLKPSDLVTHEEWESVPLLSHAQRGTIDVPVSVALSPNEALVCCISSPLLGSHFAVQTLPRRVSREGDALLSMASNLQGDLSKHLVAAIHARYSPSDVIHALAMPSLPIDVTVNTLYQTYATMEKDSFGLMEMWTSELLGVAIEVYSARAQRLERGAEQDLCVARWQTAHEIASLSACCSAFGTCSEGSAYDLDAVWQLLGMTSWVIDFVEKVLKDCIFVGERPDPRPMTSTDSEPLSSHKTLDHPVFLHLVHPYALRHLQTAVEHVKCFHRHVSAISAKGEESQIIQSVLLDITEGSGVDINQLGPLLGEVLREGEKLEAQDLLRSLASCSPVTSLRPHVRKVVDKILTSPAIDRSRLFIKPHDLSDGINRLTLSDPAAGAQQSTLKDKDMDIVRKGIHWRNKAAPVCVRCGGRSDVVIERKVGTEASLNRWQSWEKTWQLRCVCGGLWSSPI